MKPVIINERCFASKTVCTAIKCCPVGAASYVETDVAITDKLLNCNCNDPNRIGKIPVTCTDDACGCNDSVCGNDLYACGGTPYGRIIIDYDKCTRCGLCVKECCGTAIGLFPEDFAVAPLKGNIKPQETSGCGCSGGCC